MPKGIKLNIYLLWHTSARKWPQVLRLSSSSILKNCLGTSALVKTCLIICLLSVIGRTADWLFLHCTSVAASSKSIDSMLMFLIRCLTDLAWSVTFSQISIASLQITSTETVQNCQSISTSNSEESTSSSYISIYLSFAQLVIAVVVGVNFFTESLTNLISAGNGWGDQHIKLHRSHSG